MPRQKSSRPTMEDIAPTVGISLSTVDRMLNGRSNARAQTADRILEAAHSVDYHATGVILARIRSMQPRRALGFLL